MGIEIGDLPEARIAEAYRVFSTALQFESPAAEVLERRRPGWFADRAVAAYDGTRVVGHAGSMPFETMLPGGALVPTAGLTRVGVLPSHRRQGALTGMISEHLRRARAGGAVLGSLRASEAAIYGRFGYGLAGLTAGVRVRTHKAVFRQPVEVPGRFAVLQGPGLIEAASTAYRRCMVRPGALTRPDWYWRLMYDSHLRDEPSVADWGVVHYDTHDRPDGFARWETKNRQQWFEKGATITVDDLFGATPLVEAGLWRFIFDLDLVEVVTSDARPVDEPLRHRLVDSRAWESIEVWDEQWVRVLDVQAVLGARSYAVDDNVVIDIDHDPVFAGNLGRYELGTGGCRRTRRSPDLRCGISELGAVVLGGTTFANLAAAGRITEVRKGAAGRADAMFRVPLAPWCGTFF